MKSLFLNLRKRLPEGYPLPPIDARGAKLSSGMPVRIVSIPDWLTRDLPKEEALELKALEGQVLSILEIDAYGMVWFGEDAPWFCVRPKDVMRIVVQGPY